MSVKKRIIIIVLSVLLFMGGFLSGKIYNIYLLNNDTKENQKAVKLYNKWLQGEKEIYSSNGRGDGLDIADINVPTGEPDKRYATWYTFFDSNQDGILELHVKSSRNYMIFTYKKHKMVYLASPYSLYQLQNNGSYLYLHYGGAPSHEDYIYMILDYKGNEQINIHFSRYDSNSDGIYDEKDRYFYEGVNVSYEEWTSMTEDFFSAGTDQITWTKLCEKIE